MMDIVEHWHVGYTAPNGEKKAKKALREANYATFLPLERVRKKRFSHGKPKIEWMNFPLFSRYIFVGARAGQGLFAANEADGISMILHVGENPLVVPEWVMNALMQKADADGIVSRHDLTARQKFKRGQQVTFGIDSPFSGFIATVRSDAGKEVRVFLELLGKQQKMTVDPKLLTAL